MEIAINGRVALDRLGKRRFDLCLVDIRIPEMNGIELYARMEEKYPYLSNRVIFTTGDVMSPVIKKFLEKGNKPFLPKPFTLDELRVIVKTTIGEL